jgi:pimeloyl-ACP methyl ester carboxylesterase
MGGAVVLTLALTNPELADFLVLIGTGGRLKVNPMILESLKNGVIDPDTQRLAFSPSTPDELIEKEIAADMNGDPYAAYNAMLACDKFNAMDQLPSIGIPACIIVGEDDISTPPKYSEFMLDKLPRAKLTVIEKAGHFVMLEQPEAVNKCMRDFVTSF